MIDKDKIVSVYSGLAGRCYCGCSGKHYYASRVRHMGMQINGYEFDDEDISDKQITRIVNIINKNIHLASGIENVYVTVTLGKRDYTAYFSK